ncbi:hypothetical protein EX30DRAFT_223688 [Ascodesmis nigricans]|uniref:Uncharacterized protein n=1 Tax=Ascodesmis nigricans TaxID=341454 RepID=A0A4V3SHP2_9PEZI|nr:hypothetical protein EX30DRAFT_223688 [Ascodesmis nigricans]
MSALTLPTITTPPPSLSTPSNCNRQDLLNFEPPRLASHLFIRQLRFLGRGRRVCILHLPPGVRHPGDQRPPTESPSSQPCPARLLESSKLSLPTILFLPTPINVFSRVDPISCLGRSSTTHPQRYTTPSVSPPQPTFQSLHPAPSVNKSAAPNPPR